MMSKFRKVEKKKVELNTSALPDIVFLLLFFFMMSATIRPQESPLEIQEPRAESLSVAEHKELIKELQIGAPKVGSDGVTILFEGRELQVADIPQWAIEQRNTLAEYLQPQMIVLIRADEAVKMGLISDIQQELRKVNARKVLYRSKVEVE